MIDKLIMAVLGCIIAGLIIVALSPMWNPFAPSGEITGIFIEGYHKGYGDFCGDYPSSRIRLSNSTYNEEHFYDGTWFYFGNQYTGIDNMIEGQEYKIWYHQSSRPSDTTSGDDIEYWVIDDIKKL